MNSSIYVNTPVLEREHSLKYALNVMGCRPLPYWLGTLAFDFLAYFSTFLVFFYSLVHYEVDFIQPFLVKFFFTMVAFGFALIVFAYLCGFLFSSSNSAFKSFPLIAFFIGYNLPFIANFFVKSFAPSFSRIVETIFNLVSPFFTLSRGKHARTLSLKCTCKP